MFKKPTYPEVEPVVLKPIKGIRPGVYILALISFLLLLAILVIGLLPGLASNSSYVSFNSPVSKVAVFEEDRFLGNASGTVLRTTAGKHHYSYMYEGIEIGNEEVEIKRHYFFTLFTHRVQQIIPNLNLTVTAFDKGQEIFAESVALYSAVLDYDRSYNYPPLFKSFASDAVAFGKKDIKDIWLYGALHVTSVMMYEDYLEGTKILQKSSCDYESAELAEVEKLMEKLFGNNSTSKISKIDQSSDIHLIPGPNYASYEAGILTLGKDTTLTYPETNYLPVTLSYEGFSMANTVVTEYDYALFVNDNPKWAKSNLENLKAEGLVDDYYLGGITLTTAVKSKRPIRNVSYYAAKAYAEWLSEIRGVSYELPSEVEWVVAAKSAENKPFGTSLISEDVDVSSPIGMMGQLWEFTSTPYVPLSRCSYEKALELAKEFDYDDIIIKGGSYVNANDGVTEETVGVISKDACSDFCGFRVVMK